MTEKYSEFFVNMVAATCNGSEIGEGLVCERREGPLSPVQGAGVSEAGEYGTG